MKRPLSACEYAKIRMCQSAGTESLYCSVRDLWINPTGYTCDLCQSDTGRELWRGLLEPMFFTAISERNETAAAACLRRLATPQHAGTTTQIITSSRLQELLAHAAVYGLSSDALVATAREMKTEVNLAQPETQIFPPCSVRGKKRGEIECPSCKGSVRLFSFDCPFVSEGVTIQRCVVCDKRKGDL